MILCGTFIQVTLDFIFPIKTKGFLLSQMSEYMIVCLSCGILKKFSDTRNGTCFRCAFEQQEKVCENSSFFVLASILWIGKERQKEKQHDIDERVRLLEAQRPRVVNNFPQQVQHPAPVPTVHHVHVANNIQQVQHVAPAVVHQQATGYQVAAQNQIPAPVTNANDSRRRRRIAAIIALLGLCFLGGVLALIITLA